MLHDLPDPLMWEYTIVHTDHLNGPSGPQLAPIWRRKYADGSTDWDQIISLGADGWEMVNAFPVESGGSLQYLAFVFKRPKRPGASPTPRDQTRLEAAVSDPATPEQPVTDQAAPTGRGTTNA